MTKSFILGISIVFSSILGYSQNSISAIEISELNYTILNPESVTNIKDYEIALSKTGTDRFRLDTEQMILEFESGLRIQLASKAEIKNPNIISPIANENAITYRLTPDLYVIGLYQSRNSQKNASIKQTSN